MRRIGILILSLLLAGCAVKTQAVSLVQTDKADVLFCGDALSRKIGLAPLIDKRPAEERTGNKPGGKYFLLYNARRGDYVTSDAEFNEPVLPTLAEGLKSAIERTNCFVETKLINRSVSAQPRAEELLILMAHDKVDYVLVSELKHFYGKQSQNANFYALPLYYINMVGSGNNVGAALGYTEFFFTLYETNSGRAIWNDRIMTHADSSIEGAYPDMARDSFFEAAEKLANELYRVARVQQ